MAKSEVRLRKYELSGSQIRDIAESYAYLAVLYDKLEKESNPTKRKQIARKIIDKALPFYRSVLPKDLDYHPRQLINPGALEETCKKILAQSVDNS